jgi:hypothetical protein
MSRPSIVASIRATVRRSRSQDFVSNYLRTDTPSALTLTQEGTLGLTPKALRPSLGATQHLVTRTRVQRRCRSTNILPKLMYPDRKQRLSRKASRRTMTS